MPLTVLAECTVLPTAVTIVRSCAIDSTPHHCAYNVTCRLLPITLMLSLNSAELPSSLAALFLGASCHPALPQAKPTSHLCCAAAAEALTQPDSAKSTAGLLSADDRLLSPPANLLSPTASTSFPMSPPTPRISVSQASDPGSRGYLADGVTRWGSFTQEQLAAFG